MKKCCKCGKTKDFSEFYKNKTKKDGLQTECKECVKQYRKANKTKASAYNAEWRAKAQPCVYRIKHKVSGSYYIGQTTRPFCKRVSDHFTSKTNPESPFTGLNKDEWDCEVLCYGTKQEVKDLEKALLNTRVGQDPLCLNKQT